MSRPIEVLFVCTGISARSIEGTEAERLAAFRGTFTAIAEPVRQFVPVTERFATEGVG